MVKHIHVPIPNQRSESASSHVVEEGAVRTALTVQTQEAEVAKLQGFPEDRMDIHKNARLTPKGRERIVRQVLSGQTPKAAALSYAEKSVTV